LLRRKINMRCVVGGNGMRGLYYANGKWVAVCD